MPAYYRKISKYKYQLTRDYSVKTPITGYLLGNKYVQLDPDGLLTIHEGYAWDGPSGPTIDTDNFMRGSLVHDALYQLMRMDLIPQECRVVADRLLRDICLEDGMSDFRAGYVYEAVREFAANNAKPHEHDEFDDKEYQTRG